MVSNRVWPIVSLLLLLTAFYLAIHIQRYSNIDGWIPFYVALASAFITFMAMVTSRVSVWLGAICLTGSIILTLFGLIVAGGGL